MVIAIILSSPSVKRRCCSTIIIKLCKICSVLTYYSESLTILHTSLRHTPKLTASFFFTDLNYYTFLIQISRPNNTSSYKYSFPRWLFRTDTQSETFFIFSLFCTNNQSLHFTMTTPSKIRSHCFSV